MKKIILILLSISISFVTLSQQKVALFDPVGLSNIELSGMVREQISTFLVNSNDYTVVERVNLSEFLKEKIYQDQGWVDTVSELGKQKAADLVCVIIFKKPATNYFITAKLVNVETAVVQKQEYIITENGVNDIFDKTEKLAKKLFIPDWKPPVIETTCDVCNGKGYFYDEVDCNNCTNGKITVMKMASYTHDICPKCDGVGKYQLCVICNGSGKTTDYKGNIVSCTTCGGDGTIAGIVFWNGDISGSICDKCGGDGKINEKQISEGGTYQENCPECNGKGTIRKKIKCSRCKGTGVIKK